ncbi:MAG: FG-GAP repeat protein [Candidatus Hydrogenedentes bacterium]|nr:FG-GAP repeat protein [Candidatus Hydrogenedentota bacterium]
MTTNRTILCIIMMQLASLAAVAQLPPLIDLCVPPGTETTPLFQVYGDDAGDYLGTKFEYADVNGDGADDLILGAPGAGGSTGNPRAGEVYVVYGSAYLPGGIINLNTDGATSPVGETRILGDKGDSTADPKGERDFGIVTAGDVNGDGFDDIIASARLACPFGREWAGSVFVFYGSAALPGNLFNLETDRVTSQFGETRILGKGAYDQTGVTTLASGDFNGDGYDDVAFGTQGDRNLAYIYYGSPTLPGCILDMNGSNNETKITGDGSGVGGNAFPSALGAGDINGDGFDDLLLGAAFADTGGRTDAGAVYVLYGGAALPGTTVDLRNPATSNGTTHILGDDLADSTGWSLAGGDIDGDGIDDVIVGAPSADPAGRVSAGATYVIYGHADLSGTVLDLNNPIGTHGETRVLGDEGAEGGFQGDSAGSLVSCSDINGDGLDDVIVGAPRARHPVIVGETYVIYGSTSLRGMTVDLNNNDEDIRVLGQSKEVTRDGMGKGLADLDMDGFADFATFVLNDPLMVEGTVLRAGGIVVVFGGGTVPSATATEMFKAGFAPRKGMGGRLSPVLRTWLSFQEGDDGNGGASLATVTLTRSDPAITNLCALEHVADVAWDVNWSRVGCTTADVVFQYLDSEIAGLTEEDIQLFEAASLSGPWTPVEGQALEPIRNEIGGAGTGRYYAIADLVNTCPTAQAGVDVAIKWADQIVTTILGQAFDPDPNPTVTYRWLNVTGGGAEVLFDWMPTGQAFEADLDLGALPLFPIGEYVLRLEVSDGICTVFDDMTLVITNSAPAADAGDNVMIISSEQATTALQGTVTDVDGDSLMYRWLVMNDGDSTVLLPSTPAGSLGEAVLDLAQIQQLPVGQRTLRLEVTDGIESGTDDMVLTIDNAPPAVTLVGCGTYSFGEPVVIDGSASDFDGDLLDWAIVEDGEDLATGQVQTCIGGAPVSLGAVDLTGAFGVGSHTLTLSATDGINEVLSDSCVVTIVDTEVPMLVPVPSVSQLWPPNHELVPVTVYVNARDNSGDPIALRVSVICDEPADALGTGTTEPDWIIDGIEPGPGGRIELRLRSERSGKGDGRVYTITIVAEDSSGNTSSAQVQIVSPHDRGKK